MARRGSVTRLDPDAELEAAVWIEEVTGEQLLGESLGGALKDGVMLCKLVNAVKPGTIKRVNASTLAFKQMDNISSAIKAMRQLGVPEHDLFDTVDLFQETDVGKVVQALFAFGRTIQNTVPEFEGPHLGPRLATENRRSFTDEQRRASAAFLSLQTTGTKQVA